MPKPLFLIQWEDKVSALFDVLIGSDIRYLELQEAVEMIFRGGLYIDYSTEIIDSQKGARSWIHRLPKFSEETPEIYIFFRVFEDKGIINVYDFRFDKQSLN